KPVQAGYADGTDSLFVEKTISNPYTKIHPELYKLKLPASPHLAAPAEEKEITVKGIAAHLPVTSNQLIIEGAGGLLAPLNQQETILTLIKKLNAKVIIVSRNELGSINHSLLTAAVLSYEKIDVAGWIFTDDYMHYENEIAGWSGFPLLGRIKHLSVISKDTIKEQALKLHPMLKSIL
ncbi:MAG TPA: dethiobiotin synthase, partial [Hanamia sp.]|nr:dethiobiotin synthase [Hanamia sp.]